jgi:tetratricopeptide (TPR) repeat protein
MSRINQLSWSVLCALSAAGCASFNDPAATAPWRIQPTAVAMPEYSTADSAYRAGRRHHGSLRYDRAIAAYRQALYLDPSHAGARSGLGILLSSVGRHDEAVRELKAAVAIAPHQAHLHNNLGYAQLLRGSLPEALKEFEEAKRLEPSNHRVNENLHLVRKRLAAPAQPRVEPSAVTAPPARPAVPAEKPAIIRQAEGSIVQVAPNIYEMRQPKPVVQVSALPAVSSPLLLASLPAPADAARIPALSAAVNPAPAAGAAASIRLEVSNGNGLNGFARRIAGALARLGWANSRLTNQLPFRQAVTEVQYRAGFAAEAIRLASGLRPGVVVIRNDSLAAHIDVRLVLGRDAWAESDLLRKDAPGHGSVRLVAEKSHR